MSSLPRRCFIDQELHARPYVRLGRNLSIFHFAFDTGEYFSNDEWLYVSRQFYELLNNHSPVEKCRFFTANSHELSVRYERHTEFAAISLIYVNHTHPAQGYAIPHLFSQQSLARLPTKLVNQFPGSLLTASWIEMTPRGEELNPADIEALFGHDNFAGSAVADGDARVFMSLKLDDSLLDGAGLSRTLIQNPNLRTRRTGRLLQRVLDIETYRAFSLLALPVVRANTPALSRLEDAIANISTAMTHSSAAEVETIQHQNELHQLSAVTAEIEQIAAQTSYRLAATRAYNTLVERRVVEIRETRIESFQTIAEFLDRRLAPAMRTCSAFSERIESLASRAQRTNNLLRTRIEMQIQIQNQSLLRSMESRARTQLRLQETVEGLSVAAISYYLISLLNYVLKAITLPWVKDQHYTLLAIAIPIVATSIWFGVRSVRKKIKQGNL